MENCPLFSFVIVSYKNYNYIFECVDSVLAQDYPNIEIIISNDGSNDFNEKELKAYINKNKKVNIKNVYINCNTTNVGTIKNINKALSFVKGEYVMMLAADDALDNESVFSSFIDYFKKNPDMSIVTSQCGMYDVDLKTFLHNAVSPDQIEIIKKCTPLELYNELSVACLVPAGGCCYRREVYEKYGYYDEEFFLIEDWSFFLRISRMGAKIGWLDITAMKHRAGGISHGNTNNDNKAMFHYYDDVIKITEKEILPYFNMISKDKRKRVKHDYNNVKAGYVKNFKWQNYSLKEKILFCATNFDIILMKLIKKNGSPKVNIRVLDKLSEKRVVLFVFSILMLLVYSVCDFETLLPIKYSSIIKPLVGYIGIISFIVSLITISFLLLGIIFEKTIQILDKLSESKRLIFIFSTFMLLIYSVCDFETLLPAKYSSIVKPLVGYIGLTCFASSFIIVVLLLFRKAYRVTMKILHKDL